MPLRTIRTRSLADTVFEQLATEILNGHHAPGTTLPAERSLSQTFGVNRHVVREALRRLEQLGLLRVSQGGATKVLDYNEHAGLDTLALMAEYARGGKDTAQYWLATFEMCAAIGPDIARLCALRASPELRAELTEITSSMTRETDPQRLFALDARLWQKMIDGADNIAYRLAFNSLMKGVYAIAEVAQEWTVAELRRCEFRVPVTRAIASGDADAAEAAARTALRGTVQLVRDYTTAVWAAGGSAEPAAEEKQRSPA